MNISTIINSVISVEGNFSNNPHDLGGATMFGITLRSYRNWKKDQSITPEQLSKISRQEAYDFYYDRFFISTKINLIFDISPNIAYEMVDTDVNQGEGTSARYLQRSLNLFNRSHAALLYPELTVDGAIGPATLNALKDFLRIRRTSDGENVLLATMNILQGYRYIEITEARKQNEEFIYGWIKNRVNLGK